jgi:hypothetical protein
MFTVYKVFRSLKGFPVSLNYNANAFNAGVFHYKINEWQKPDIGKFFIHLNVYNAMDMHVGDQQLWRCYTHAYQRTHFILDPFCMTENDVENFWNNKIQKIDPMLVWDMKNLYVADDIYLEERIK